MTIPAAERQAEGGAKIVENFNSNRYKFMVDFKVRHPTVTAETISGCLNETPTRSWSRGDEFGTTPQQRQFSFWSYREKSCDRNDFFGAVYRLLIWATERKAAIVELKSQGASVFISINISGECDFGDVLTCETMNLAVNLGLQIELEFFTALQYC